MVGSPPIAVGQPSLCRARVPFFAYRWIGRAGCELATSQDSDSVSELAKSTCHRRGKIMHFTIDSSFVPDPSRAQETLRKELGFGVYFADRMLLLNYDEGRGWHSGTITKMRDLQLSPAAAVLHYGQALFEGLKAYARADGEVSLFRPDMNAKRMNRSAQRMMMPEIPEELFVGGVRDIVDLERAWVPKGEMQSLYIRPFMFATEPLQGVRPAKQYLFSIILSPVGAYYSGGFKPVKILVCEDYVRAVKGGTGAAKFAGNYAASLIAGRQAQEKGCDQVLWLDGAQRKYIEEIGAMNVMFVIDGKLVTPPLGGSILPGVTRECVLRVAQDKGITVEERPIEIDELMAAIREKRCTEAFGCGTAAVISAIGSFVYQGSTFELPSAPGPVSQELFKTLTDLQWGRSADPYGWTQIVERRHR
jgi:branched-chain amino acid aminotransferase